MKKSVSKIVKFFFGLFILSSVISCDNFLQGEDVIKKLDDEIIEANALSVEVIITPDSGYGTTIPNGSIEKKVGYPFTVMFNQSAGYQFKCWEAVNARTGELIEDGVTIEDPCSLETEVTITSKIDNVRIRPACYERAGVSSFAPAYADIGIARDSSILITFTKDIDADNDFSKISILCGGEDARHSFNEPVLNGNILTFTANRKNLIEVESGKTRTVTVNIPADIYYTENETRIPVGSDSTYSYKINSTTNTKSEITVSTTPERGTVTPNVTKAYNIGETFVLKFEPNSDYNFTGWNIFDGEGNPVPDTVLKIENINSSTTNVTVLSEIAGVSITPKSVLIPKILTSPENVIAGKCYDKSLVFTFNKEMDTETVTLSTEDNPFGGSVNILNFANPNEHCEKYFDLECQGNTLTLVPKNQIKELVDVANSVFTFKVEFNANENQIKDTEGNVLEGTTAYVYKINSSYEDVPIVMTVNAAKKTDAFTTKTGLLKQGKFEALVTELKPEGFFIDTYHLNSVYFDYNLYDEVGGPSKIKITEKVLYTAFGTDLRSLNNVSSKEYDISSLQSNNGNYKWAMEYQFDTNLPDGIVELTITPIDIYGREGNSVTYAVVKDTKFDVTAEVNLSFGLMNSGEYATTIFSEFTPETFDYLKEAMKYIAIYNVGSEIWATYDGKEYSSNLLDYEIEVKHFNKNEEETGTAERIFSKGDPEIDSNSDFIYKFNQMISGEDDSVIQLKITDKAGNVCINKTDIFAAPTILYVDTFTDSDGNERYRPVINSGSIENASIGEIAIFYDVLDEQNNIIKSDHFGLGDEYEYTFWPFEVGQKYRCYVLNFWSNGFSKEYIIDGGNELGNNSDLKNPLYNASYEPVRLKNSNKAILKIDTTESYSNYDSMYVSLYTKDRSGYYYLANTYCLDKSIYEIEIDSTQTFYTQIAGINVTGIKAGKTYKGTMQGPFNLSSEKADDYTSPSIYGHDIDEYGSSFMLNLTDLPKNENLFNGDDLIEVTAYWGATDQNYIYQTESQLLNLENKRTVYLKQKEISIRHSAAGSNVSMIDQFYMFPLEDLYKFESENNKAFIFFQLKDGNNNTYFTSSSSAYYLGYEKNKIKLKDDNSFDFNWPYEIIHPRPNYAILPLSFVQYYDEGEWKNLKKNDTIFNNHRFLTSNPYKFNSTAETELSGKFIRVWGAAESYRTAPLYIYYTSNPDDRKCKTKSFIYNQQLTVIHDKPVIVQTLYSPVDLGNDVDTWERYCANQHKVNIQMLTPDDSIYNNYEIDLTMIPPEYKDTYKVVIIHYADGTSELVRIKEF